MKPPKFDKFFGYFLLLEELKKPICEDLEDIEDDDEINEENGFNWDLCPHFKTAKSVEGNGR
jgi:hypothetical protein